MFELPKGLEEKYEHIRLITPELEDYKEYAKISKAPVSEEQFIDVATFIATWMIPKNLNLTSEEKTILAGHHMLTRMKALTDALIENPE